MMDYNKLNIHQKIELLVKELVEKELPMEEVVSELKKIFIQTTLKKYKGTKTKVAKSLGIHRNTLNNLIKKYKIKM